jgi:UDP-3-O-[3-hydroxymyristoyl] glucosamine N-acyltransferase LpxD
MYKLKSPDVYASEIAGFLNSLLQGPDFVVNNPTSLRDISDNSFFYIDKGADLPSELLRKHKNVLILSSKKIDLPENTISYIETKSPRSAFMKTVNEFYIEFDSVAIAESSTVHRQDLLGRGVSVGEHTVIGPEVSVGNYTKVLNNVVISGRVKIGNHCLIKDNTTIGSEGFDFECDEDGILVHGPQIGEIVIGSNVWIGANTSIEKSFVDKTIIQDNVKIDDLVQIGGSSSIHKNTMITAGVIVSRNVTVGENCLLSPNVSVRDSIQIGNDVTIGIGSVVVKDMPEGAVYVGNPARLLRKNK